MFRMTRGNHFGISCERDYTVLRDRKRIGNGKVSWNRIMDMTKKILDGDSIIYEDVRKRTWSSYS